MDKTQRTSKEHPMQWFLFFSLIFPPGLVGIHFFYFSQIFLLYFSPNRDHTRWNHKNFHLKQRWDVVYRKTDMFAETRAIT